MVMRIKKHDTVLVLSGKDKGKQGRVIDILPNDSKVLVKNVAVVTRHTKARKQGAVSEIKKKESYIDISKVMLLCNACHKPSRVNSARLEIGNRVRVCNRCRQTT
jgi:large subunit ribosomal protein L24